MEDVLSNEKQVQLFVRHVGREQVIWNNDYKDFQNKPLKCRAWKKVATSFNPEYASLTKTDKSVYCMKIVDEWKNLKSDYIKWKKDKESNPSNPAYTAGFPLIKAMYDSKNESFEHSEQPLSTTDLILAVKTHPLLWDPKDELYFSKPEKANAWNEVCQKVCSDYDTWPATEQAEFRQYAVKKWINIRDGYQKVIKKVTSSGTNRTYVHGEALSFLKPILEKKIKKTKLQPRFRNVDVESMSSKDFEEDNNEDSNDFEWTLEESEKPLKNEVMFVDQSKNVEYDSNVEAQDMTQVVLAMIKSQDDDDAAFFRSITPMVKRLNEDKKIKFRIKVMELISQLKETNSLDF